MRLRPFTAFAALLIAAAPASAQPFKLDYAVSGSAGNWLINFTVRNDMSASSDMGLYFFGFKTTNATVVSSPLGWSPFMQWTVAAGSGQSYRTTWMTDPTTGLAPGQVLTGFSIRTFDMDAPTSLRWFAYGFSNSGTTYEGGENFNGSSYNPGFESSSVGTIAQVNIQQNDPPTQEWVPEVPAEENTPDGPDQWTPEFEEPESPWNEFPEKPFDDTMDQLPMTTTPEPSTYFLMTTGLAAIGYMARKRRNTR